MKNERDCGDYSPKTLAARIGCSEKTIYRWLDLGLPHSRAGDRGRYSISWIDFVNWWKREPRRIGEGCF